jgi:hypothetical protein
MGPSLPIDTTATSTCPERPLQPTTSDSKASPIMKFVEHVDSLVRRRSAVRAVKAILGFDLYASHKARTSLGVHLEDHRSGLQVHHSVPHAGLTHCRPNELQHEHVCDRRGLIDELLASPDDADFILERAIGCVVTKAEHLSVTALSRRRPDLNGWERYKEASIDVMDIATGEGRI